MSLPRYPEYKDSGIGWLGEVPAHWEIVQSRRYFANRNEKARDTDKQLTASQKHGVLYQEAFMKLEGQKVVQVILGADILKHVEPNDFVISMRSFQGGIEWCGLRGSISSAYVMLIPKLEIRPGFFYYLFKSKSYIQALQSTTNLVRDGQALRYNNFSLVALPLFPLDEQAAIATFLDRETAKIDGLIAEQEKLIALLAEKRQATITHAIIKGLNPDAPMKDSGVPWLGLVPANWTIKKIKSVVSMRSGEGITSEEIENEGAFPVYGGNGLRGYTNRLTHTGEYLLVGRQGALCGNVHHITGEFWASEHAVVCTFIANDIPRWAFYMLGFMDLGQYSVSAAQPGLAVERIQQLSIAVPPEEEQRDIATFIDAEVARLEALTVEATHGIALLKERRSALISAAVTGKIDVRHLAEQKAA